jgi:hypothetical protein
MSFSEWVMPYKDPAKKREFQRKWQARLRDKNPGLIAKRKREYRKRHPEKLREEKQRSYARNPERWREYWRKRNDVKRYGAMAGPIVVLRALEAEVRKEVKRENKK